MAARILFHPRAERELGELFDYIAENGSPERARAFLSAIWAFCQGLTTFPRRGTVRDDIAPGVRVVGFRKRVSIAFSVEGDDIWILGVFYGGRMVALPPDEDDPS